MVCCLQEYKVYAMDSQSRRNSRYLLYPCGVYLLHSLVFCGEKFFGFVSCNLVSTEHLSVSEVTPTLIKFCLMLNLMCFFGYHFGK